MSSIIPLKRCSHCKQEKPLTAEYFPRNQNFKDGYAYECKICRKRYNPSKSQMKDQIEHKRTNHPERYYARIAVHSAVKRGILPPIKDCVCLFCAMPAQAYHHPSYAYSDRIKVIPVCRLCHEKLHNPLSELRQMGYV